MSILDLFLFLVILLLFLFSIYSFIWCCFIKKNFGNMNMVKCPDCGYKISIHSDKCSHCYSERLLDKEFMNHYIEEYYYKSNYKKKKICFLGLQILLGITVILVGEWLDNIILMGMSLFSLILNTITIIVMIIKYWKNRKKYHLSFSIFSYLAVACGIFVVFAHLMIFLDKNYYGFDSGVREIMLVESYSKEEAQELLNNLYSILDYNGNDCLELYGFWEDRELANTFVFNMRETCEGGYLPANSMKVVVNEINSTVIERIYWNFNDSVDIDFYVNGNRVNNFEYIYYNSIYHDEEPMYEIKTSFERDVKEKLKSPSSAIFTYDNIYYSSSTGRFRYEGWVEAQNSFGAMVKEEFYLNMLPCESSYCDWYHLDYSWEWR